MKSLVWIVGLWLISSFAMLGLYFASGPVLGAVRASIATIATDGLTREQRTLQQMETKFSSKLQSLLENPSTGKIIAKAKRLDDGQIQVLAQIDAKNMFGEIMRSYWRGVYDAETLELNSLDMLE